MSRFYSETECRQAKDVNLVELLNRMGVSLIKCSGKYSHAVHDSLKISEYKGWKWFSRDIGGNAIDYLMNGPDFNYSFHEAVTVIRQVMNLDNVPGIQPEIKKKVFIQEDRKEDTKEDTKKFELPEKNKENRRVSAYLNKSRGIDYEFINRCIKADILYESKDKHNAVFVGCDFEGRCKYACQRGTNTQIKFVGEVAESDKSYSFRMEGNTNVIRVFESPIDVLSYLTILKMRGHECKDTMLTLSGTALKALDTYIKESGKKIDTIVVCVDNDKAGVHCLEEIQEKYGEQYHIVENLPKCKGKDYNEKLLEVINLQKGLQR